MSENLPQLIFAAGICQLGILVASALVPFQLDLYERDARGTGEGGVIDAYLYGSALRILEWTIAAYDKLGIVRTRTGNRLDHSAPLDNYRSIDGKYVCIVAAAQNNFVRLCAAMDRHDLLADERYATPQGRAANNEAINQIVADWVAASTATRIEEQCVAHDVPVGTVYDAADLSNDEHVLARGDILSVADPVIGRVRQQAPFPRIAGQPHTAPTGAPRLGEHTDEILRDVLDLDDTERSGLRERKII